MDFEVFCSAISMTPSNIRFKTVHPQADVSTELISKPETDIKNVNSEIQNDIHHEQVVAV